MSSESLKAPIFTQASGSVSAANAGSSHLKEFRGNSGMEDSSQRQSEQRFDAELKQQFRLNEFNQKQTRLQTDNAKNMQNLRRHDEFQRQQNLQLREANNRRSTTAESGRNLPVTNRTKAQQASDSRLVGEAKDAAKALPAEQSRNEKLMNKLQAEESMQNHSVDSVFLADFPMVVEPADASAFEGKLPFSLLSEGGTLSAVTNDTFFEDTIADPGLENSINSLNDNKATEFMTVNSNKSEAGVSSTAKDIAGISLTENSPLAEKFTLGGEFSLQQGIENGRGQSADAKNTVGKIIDDKNSVSLDRLSNSLKPTNDIKFDANSTKQVAIHSERQSKNEGLSTLLDFELPGSIMKAGSGKGDKSSAQYQFLSAQDSDFLSEASAKGSSKSDTLGQIISNLNTVSKNNLDPQQRLTGVVPQSASTINVADIDADLNTNLNTTVAAITDSSQFQSNQIQSTNTYLTPLQMSQNSALTVQASNFTQGMAARISWLMNQTIKSAEIAMDPPELGHLNVRIHQHNGETSVMFQVHNNQAKELLSDNLPRLKEMLEQQGLQLADAHVKDQSAQHEQQQSENNNGGASSSQGNLANENLRDAELSDSVVSALVSNYSLDQFV